jgi:hypothetical protein
MHTYNVTENQAASIHLPQRNIRPFVDLNGKRNPRCSRWLRMRRCPNHRHGRRQDIRGSCEQCERRVETERRGERMRMRHESRQERSSPPLRSMRSLEIDGRDVEDEDADRRDRKEDSVGGK